MTLSLLRQQANNLKTEIILKQARYDQAIKDDKLLKETRKMFKEIRAMEKKLELLMENKNEMAGKIGQ